MNLEDYTKYYIQGSDHYLIPKNEFVELFNEMVNWKEESIELNKKYVNAVSDYEITMAEKVELERRLEEYKNSHYCSFIDTCKSTKIANYNQQKEFIKYLEDETSKWRNNYDSYNYEYEIEEPTAEELVNEILQKYREIIGVSDEIN